MIERAAVRDDTVTRLIGKTDAGARVFPSRTVPLKEVALPAICIFTTREEGRNDGVGVPVLKRTLQLAVQAFASAATDEALEEAADTLAEQITDTLLTDPAWVAQFEKVVSVDTQIALNAEGDRRRIAALILFTLQMRSMVYEPVIPDDFTDFHADVDAIDPSKGPGPGPDGQNEATIDLELEPPP